MSIHAGEVLVGNFIVIRALVDFPTYGIGSAADDITDGSFMTWQHAIAVLCAVSRAVLAHDIGHIYHDDLLIVEHLIHQFVNHLIT